MSDWKTRAKPVNQSTGGWKERAQGLRSQLESQTQEPSSFNVDMRSQESPISAGDRAIIKNLASNPAVAKAFIQKNYPNLEVGIFNDEIVTRNKGEANFKPIDPSSFSVKEIGQDITDVAYDIPAGAVQNLAATAAGIKAGLASGGLATLPAAALASGATGAALEVGRQGLGSVFGLENNMNAGNIKSAGAFGFAAPLVTGVDRLPESLKQSGRGFLKRGVDAVGPAATEFFTGIDKPTQQYFRQNKDVIKSIAEGGGDRQLVKSGGEKLFNYAKETKEELLGNAGNIQKGAKEVDIASVKKSFTDAIEQLEPENFRKTNGDLPNEIEDATRVRLKSYYNSLFGLKYPDAPDLKNIPEASKVYQEIDSLLKVAPNNQAANFSDLGVNLPQKRNVPSSGGSYYLPGEENRFLDDVNAYVRGQTDEQISQLNAEAKALAKAANISEENAKQALIKQKVEQLKDITKANTRTEKLDKQTGVGAFNLKQQLKLFSDSLQKGNLTGELSPTETAIQAQVSRPVNEAYGALNNAFDVATGGQSKAANEAATRFLSPLGEYEVIKKGITTKGELDPQKTYSTLVNLGRPSKQNILGVIENLRGQGAIDLEEPNQLRALNAFYGPSDDSFLLRPEQVAPRKTAIQSATGAIGSLLGYKLGGGYAGAAVGGGAGVMGGAGLSSKGAARFYNNLGSGIDRLSASPWLQVPVLNPTNPALNPWLFYPNQQEQP